MHKNIHKWRFFFLRDSFHIRKKWDAEGLKYKECKGNEDIQKCKNTKSDTGYTRFQGVNTGQSVMGQWMVHSQGDLRYDMLWWHLDDIFADKVNFSFKATWMLWTWMSIKVKHKSSLNLWLWWGKGFRCNPHFCNSKHMYVGVNYSSYRFRLTKTYKFNSTLLLLQLCQIL